MTRVGRQAPRLVLWISGMTFAVLAGVLALVFVALSWQTESRLAESAAADLERGQQWFADAETRRARERRLQAIVLAENPTLKAAVDTYVTETASGTTPDALLPTVTQEVGKLAVLLGVPALIVVTTEGDVLSAAGPQAGDWAVGSAVPELLRHVDSDVVVTRGARTYLATATPLLLGREIVGTVASATPLDDAYARSLGAGAGADVVIVRDGRLLAASTDTAAVRHISAADLSTGGVVETSAGRVAVGRVFVVGSTSVYAVASVDEAAAAATARVLRAMLVVGMLALVLAAGASGWLARRLARPIDALTTSLAHMADARDLAGALPRTGVSREIDALADAFDTLRSAVASAEAESEAAYSGVIAALAAALDARDPYTAGHSQRVSTLSVYLAEAMEVPEPDRETLRLGALLHDIGKIGIHDAVLRKPGRLTDEEAEHIKLHPVLGARILQPVPFLRQHIEIVELHHERPDGTGYPHGLSGDAIPLFARIVHVADAFDAMTSARAYRPGRPAAEAMAELWRCVGTDFDVKVVQAMGTVWENQLVKTGGVIPVEPLPFRDPATSAPAARWRAPLREVRPVA